MSTTKILGIPIANTNDPHKSTSWCHVKMTLAKPAKNRTPPHVQRAIVRDGVGGAAAMLLRRLITGIANEMAMPKKIAINRFAQ